MTNKKAGNDFETKFCEILSENGFWCHNLAQNASGQPADVIAVRRGRAYLIDCKVCKARGFALSRMEENQDLSMDLWDSCGNKVGWFAMLVGEEIIMVPHTALKELRKQKCYATEMDLNIHGIPLERWLSKW